MYIYENHMGGLYSSKEIIKNTYCSSCGDSDQLIGNAKTRKEAWNLLKSYTDTFDPLICKKCSHDNDPNYCDSQCENFANSGGYNYNYVQNFIKRNWQN